MSRSTADVLDHHAISAERGFLPEADPPARFDVDGHEPSVAEYLRAVDRLGAELPERIDEGTFRPAVEGLETPPDGTFGVLTDREATRLCMLCGFFASAYVHELGADPVDRLPAGAAVPLYRTSRRFEREPILSYDVLCLHNWKRRDPAAGFDPENLEAVQRFTALDDERWFVVIHVAIEARAGAALRACARAQRAVREDEPDALVGSLGTVADSLEAQTAIMRRMTEGNDPEAFANRYRPYYEGFDELVYEGVEAFEGTPRTYRGGSGAQSSALPSIDAALGIDHASTALIEKLFDMRSYMPATHRTVIDAFDAGPDVEPYVAASDRRDLREAYNRCVEELAAFREVHFGQVIQYIREVTGDTTGTGGTDYVRFLREMTAETEAQML
ncbi:indoleamine 2,3-dioxygenase [Halovivax sp.]|uniref:indoleamine 2,3-dioxygenase n=1 Tax=Halovivax sp. TaxID=1935978 RepID=UPI0025BFB4E9|nr:indoleamine 2,3-dioxygenase [Halovivax sp.]